MRHIWRVYRQLFLMNLQLLMAYRVNFFNKIISSLCWGLFMFYSSYMLTYNVTNIFSWPKESILVLTGVISIILGFFHSFFTPNFDNFTRLTYTGSLEGILIKPFDSQLLLTIYFVQFPSLIRIVMGILFLTTLQTVHYSVFSVVLSLVFMLFGLLLLYSFWFCILCITVWLPRLSNIKELMFSVTGSMRIPSDAYFNISPIFWIILIPILSIAQVPTRTLLGIASWQEQCALIAFAFGGLLLSRIIWFHARRVYSGSSFS